MAIVISCLWVIVQHHNTIFFAESTELVDAPQPSATTDTESLSIVADSKSNETRTSKTSTKKMSSEVRMLEEICCCYLKSEEVIWDARPLVDMDVSLSVIKCATHIISIRVIFRSFSSLKILMGRRRLGRWWPDGGGAVNANRARDKMNKSVESIGSSGEGIIWTMSTRLDGAHCSGNDRCRILAFVRRYFDERTSVRWNFDEQTNWGLIICWKGLLVFEFRWD